MRILQLAETVRLRFLIASCIHHNRSGSVRQLFVQRGHCCLERGVLGGIELGSVNVSPSMMSMISTSVRLAYFEIRHEANLPGQISIWCLPNEVPSASAEPPSSSNVETTVPVPKVRSPTTQRPSVVAQGPRYDLGRRCRGPIDQHDHRDVERGAIVADCFDWIVSVRLALAARYIVLPSGMNWLATVIASPRSRQDCSADRARSPSAAPVSAISLSALCSSRPDPAENSCSCTNAIPFGRMPRRPDRDRSARERP